MGGTVWDSTAGTWSPKLPLNIEPCSLGKVAVSDSWLYWENRALALFSSLWSVCCSYWHLFTCVFWVGIAF